MGAFTGKTVLILGGSRGIGAAIVRRFVTDGANVRFTYAGSKDAAEHLAQETGATAVVTDSADRDAVIDVVRKSGALDILVVNAGIGVFGDALELNADDIDRLFKIKACQPCNTHRRPVWIRWGAKYFIFHRHDVFELFFWIGMKARNINDIVKSASRSCQGRMQIIKCQSDLLLKIGFWCSVLSTSYLPGNKQQIAGTNSRRITMLSIQ